MKNNWQVVLAGDGGQGLIVGGRILAYAAILEGKNAVQTQSYGIAARGGYSEAQVLISEGEVYSPKCEKPNLVLALTQTAYDRYYEQVDKDCLIIYEKDVVTPKRARNDLGYPFKETCLEVGSLKVINVLFLGVILKNMSIVKEDSMVDAIKEMLPPKIHALNLKAFYKGFNPTNLA
ncbi:2-oxoacid:acceptor oxidoreductase family protein [Desulfoscipio sp. XC116]|uniref:2-oxoacid:acceptor oxidoreductase family protein n=1 Tax=Desulfoscipio sp. XC116 TaxID=3144975 RepID=UPI00325AA365